MIKAIIFDFAGPIMVWDDKEIYKKHEIKHSLKPDTILNLMTYYFHCANLGEYENIFDYYEKTKPEVDLTVEDLNNILKEVSSTVRIRSESVSYIKELKKKYKIAIAFK